MNIFAVIDTNVIVSALITPNREAPTYKVVQKIFEGTIVPVFNNEILTEYREVLARKKFALSANLIDVVVDSFKTHGLYFEGIASVESIPDPKDIVFYRVLLGARQTNDAVLITGNMKHFPAVDFVVSPKEIIDKISLVKSFQN